MKYSKTNQFQKRSFELKLLPVDHILCPVSAIHKAFALICLPPGARAFVTSEHATAMTGSFFNAKFKQLVAATGRDASSYSSHNFHRGGASWGLQCGVPGDVIQSLGDWRSDCYMQYLDALPQAVHDHSKMPTVRIARSLVTSRELPSGLQIWGKDQLNALFSVQ